METASPPIPRRSHPRLSASRLAVKTDHGAVGLAVLPKRGVDLCLEFLMGLGEGIRYLKVKDKLGALRGAKHAEIMDSEPGINCANHFFHKGAHFVEFRITSLHRIIVNNEVHVELPQGVAFDIINDLVANLGRFIGAEFHMYRGKIAAGAVIMHQQVMNAEDAPVAENELADAVQEQLVRLPAQQGGNGLPGDIEA